MCFISTVWVGGWPIDKLRDKCASLSVEITNLVFLHPAPIYMRVIVVIFCWQCQELDVTSCFLLRILVLISSLYWNWISVSCTLNGILLKVNWRFRSLIIVKWHWRNYHKSSNIIICIQDVEDTQECWRISCLFFQGDDTKSVGEFRGQGWKINLARRYGDQDKHFKQCLEVLAAEDGDVVDAERRVIKEHPFLWKDWNQAKRMAHHDEILPLKQFKEESITFIKYQILHGWQ